MATKKRTLILRIRKRQQKFLELRKEGFENLTLTGAREIVKAVGHLLDELV